MLFKSTPLLALLFSLNVTAQKTGKYSYNKVDTVICYDDATVVIYNKSGKQVRDTIYLSSVPGQINIEETEVLINMGVAIKKRKK